MNWNIFWGILIGGALLFGGIAVVIYIRERFFANREQEQVPEPTHGSKQVDESEDDDVVITSPPPIRMRLQVALPIGMCLFLTGWLCVFAFLGAIGRKAEYRFGLTMRFGTIFGLIFTASASPLFFRYSPAFWGFLSINLWKKRVGHGGIPKALMYARGPGWHLMLPWEEVRPEYRISLRPRRIPVEEKISSLGGPFILKGSFLFTPRMHQIGRFLKTGRTMEEQQETIQGTVTDALESELAALIGPTQPDDAQGKIAEWREAVMKKYHADKNTVEKKLGGDIDQLHVTIHPGESIEKARAEAYEMGKFGTMAEAVKDVPPDVRRDVLTFVDKFDQSRHLTGWVIEVPEKIEKIAEEALKNPKIAESTAAGVAAFLGAKAGSKQPKQTGGHRGQS